MNTHSIPNPKVAEVFNSYPAAVRESLLRLRKVILSVGNGIDAIGGVEESLKWGQPSYATICGSPIRLGWNAKRPESFALYFHCQTRLVRAFQECYKDTFRYEGNRALVFRLGDRLPIDPLSRCIETAHSYHRIKQLPLLGLDAS